MRKSAVLITGANGEMGRGLITALHKKNNVNIVALDLNPLDGSISNFANEEIIGNIFYLLSKFRGFLTALPLQGSFPAEHKFNGFLKTVEN